MFYHTICTFHLQDVTYNWKHGERNQGRWGERCAGMSLRGWQNEMTWSSYHCTWNHAVLCVVGDAPDVDHCKSTYMYVVCRLTDCSKLNKHNIDE